MRSALLSSIHALFRSETTTRLTAPRLITRGGALAAALLWGLSVSTFAMAAPLEGKASLSLGGASALKTPKTDSPPAQTETDGVRRDPQGKKGISPLWEALSNGDAAFLARDYDEAITFYRVAVKADKTQSIAYARLGAALRAKGALDEAIEVFSTGHGLSTTPNIQARHLFAQADIFERQGALSQAASTWQTYLKLNSKRGDSESAAVYPETAEERLKQVKAAKQRIADYAPVKLRIQKREAELEAKATGKQK